MGQPPSPSAAPLTAGPRSAKLWVRVARRHPSVVLLWTVQFFAVPTVRTWWGPPFWLKIVGMLTVSGVVTPFLWSRQDRLAARIEQADADAERHGRRRPLDAPEPGSPQAALSDDPVRRAARRPAAVFGGCALGGAALLAAGILTTPPGPDDWVLVASMVAMMVVAPATGAVLAPASELRVMRRLRRESGPPVPLRVAGYEQATRRWVLETLDGTTRIATNVAVGRRLLVPGDVLLGYGDVAPPDRRWWRRSRAAIALSGQAYGVWARGAHLPAADREAALTAKLAAWDAADEQARTSTARTRAVRTPGVLTRRDVELRDRR